MMADGRHWQRAASRVIREIAAAVGRERLRRLQRRDGGCHLVMAAAWLAGGAAGVGLAAQTAWPLLWPVGIALAGLFAFNGTVLLHEVLHGVVFARRRPSLERALALAYALPCGIAPSQFTRWHLDHHAELGDAEADPKRRHLSPRRNSRLVKALYWTPALFFIYFRAARREAARYEAALRRTIARERWAAVLVHAALAAGLVTAFDWALWVRVHALPLLVAFPPWFALNRLGQHYAIDPADPAAWGTLMRPSPYLWDLLFLWSNYHLEHHYFPGVPAYRLPALRRALEPFFARRGIAARTYRSLLWDWFARNKPPHESWAEDMLVG
jgi:fatty acid desaturase